MPTDQHTGATAAQNETHAAGPAAPRAQVPVGEIDAAQEVQQPAAPRYAEVSADEIAAAQSGPTSHHAAVPPPANEGMAPGVGAGARPPSGTRRHGPAGGCQRTGSRRRGHGDGQGHTGLPEPSAAQPGLHGGREGADTARVQVQRCATRMGPCRKRLKVMGVPTLQRSFCGSIGGAALALWAWALRLVLPLASVRSARASHTQAHTSFTACCPS